MEQKTYWLTTADQEEVFVRNWYEPNQSPKAIIQLAHGMAEHTARYQPFAEFMVKQNFAVYGNDHRGHGYTGKKQGTLGLLDENNGFDKTVEDLWTVTKVIKREHPGKPVFLLGHSMGSFLTRRYIQLHSDKVNGVMLSGTGSHPGFMNNIGKGLAIAERKRKGLKAPSKLLNKLAFANYNRNIDDQVTDFDWLSRDAELVRAYLDDPLSGFVPTAAFFFDLFTGFDHMDDPNGIESIAKQLPMLLFSGSMDPVGKQAKGVFRTAETYYRHGISDITVRIYENGRHEMLNEINKEEVYTDVVNWIEDVLS
ncbi:alpha/beta hydrolase [Sediminibacillus halophilus]|uniref:Lysophospholipase, alpha-beta hydrolase superfamily n=1 Tax=Sediminibacillus halophilus TaxID=482461 RepID=A0A1G9R2F0_9BACI|nr:alpha/beta hydrolase [Sediminibacillus halophilus]SDM17428.1 Lysophospholipase, alpha-beta hydrolase superfamily [Sediminibacillus halophilus]